jgi:hypothetical protein
LDSLLVEGWWLVSLRFLPSLFKGGLANQYAMFKKAFLYTFLSLTYAIGMFFKIIANGFLALAGNDNAYIGREKAR